MTAAGHTPIPRLRRHAGAAVLGYGFRPFFLLSGLSAAVVLAVWLAEVAGIPVLDSRFPPLDWHIHEMLFGFAVAAVAGFLLTAIPNWTGRLPVQGTPLAALALLWLAGRLAMAHSASIGGLVAAGIDLAFLAALIAAVAREIVAGRNWRNLPMVGGLAALLVANVLMHGETLALIDAGGAGWRLAVAILILLIALIGGRIVPSFTRNWLAKRPAGPMPAPFGRWDQLTLAGTLVALVSWVILPGSDAAIAALAAAAMLNLVRLLRWQGRRTLADPLVAVLHVGWAWVPAGLALLAAAQGDQAPVTQSTAVHALTAGAVGTMILAVMTRATLGHTGRSLKAGPATTTIYLLVTLAALARIAAGLWPAIDGLLWVSGFAWIAAFAGFVGVYGPMLLRPRIDGKPG